MSEQAQQGEPTAAPVENVGQSENAQPQATETKVEFSSEQQQWLNQREKQHKEQVRQLQDQLQSFEQKLTTLDPNSFDNVLQSAKERDDKSVQIELLTKKIEEMQQSQVKQRVDGSIRSAIDEAGVDPKYSRFVQDFVKQQVQLDESGQLKVVNPETGAQRFNADGTKTLSVGDVVAETLREYSAFAPKTPTGAGVRVNESVEPQETSLTSQLKQLDPQNPNDRAKLKQLLDAQVFQQGGGERSLNVTRTNSRR